MPKLKIARKIAELKRMLACTSGVAAVEFAIVMPFIMSITLYGAEVANYTIVEMRLSEIALSLADNASRLGQTDNSAFTPSVSEDDVNAVMLGAQEQAAALDFATRGKIILTSLERDSATGRQYIHWQRCYGALARQSAYGNDSTRNGLNGAVITGMGKGTTKVTASAGSAVMFVEVYYNYEGMLGDMFVNNRILSKEGAFIIRDDRNLSLGVTGGNGLYPCT